MVEVSEGLSEERALLDYSFHCAASTRPRPSYVSCSHQTWLFPTNSNMTKARFCLAFPCSLSLFLSLCYLFLVSLSVMQLLHSLWFGLFCSTKSVRMSGRKETRLVQAGDNPHRQGNQAPGQQLLGVTGYSKLFSMTTQLSCNLKSSATATPSLLSTLLSVLYSLSTFTTKSRKSIFTPTIMNQEMCKRMKLFLLY